MRQPPPLQGRGRSRFRVCGAWPRRASDASVRCEPRRSASPCTDLAEHGLDPPVVGCDVQYVAARKTASPDADARRVTHRPGLQPVHRVQPVPCLIDRVDDPANGDHLGLKPPGTTCGVGFGENHLRIAVPLSPIVECHRSAVQAPDSTAPAVGHQDASKLLAGDGLAERISAARRVPSL